jgi:hypothetical protein
MVIRLFFPVFLVFSLVFFPGCGGQKEVTRMDPERTTDLTGGWNDTDSRQVAETMAKDALNSDWLVRFQERNDGEEPVMIVGLIKNKTHEHIDPMTFIKDIQRQFIKRDAIRIVEHGAFREKMREERSDQQKYASEDTQNKFGLELGADYMMHGSISSDVQKVDDEKVVFYKVNLELADLTTNEIVWIGDKEIKKYVEN